MGPRGAGSGGGRCIPEGQSGCNSPGDVSITSYKYILSRATFPGAPSYDGMRTWVEGSQTCGDRALDEAFIHVETHLPVMRLVRFVRSLKGPWPVSCRCLEPRWFVGDPTSLARDNIIHGHCHLIHGESVGLVIYWTSHSSDSSCCTSCQFPSCVMENYIAMT